MSHHLIGDYDMAQSILEEFRKTQQDRPVSSPNKVYDNEHSEFLLYQNLVLRESGQHEDALRHIQTYEKDIYNKLVIAEIKVDLYMQLGMNDRAERLLLDLLERNNENKKYYYLLEKCVYLKNIEHIRLKGEIHIIINGWEEDVKHRCVICLKNEKEFSLDRITRLLPHKVKGRSSYFVIYTYII